MNSSYSSFNSSLHLDFLSLPSSNYIVVDTEGKNVLSEIAIVDCEGKLIYEAYTETENSRLSSRLQRKPLDQILEDFFAIACTPQPKIIICHFAEHDRQILKNSCRRAGIKWKELTFACTVELSKQAFPKLPSYSLAYLNQHFRLLVDDKLFNARFAHAARYDATFTHRLYLKIQETFALNVMNDSLQNIPNPFSSSRVDNPFQHHIDLQTLYQGEFKRLKSILNDIKNDPNRQSRGAVVIGEAGSGKTHLMMRLATDVLKTNRLLFIRQPNNADTVTYHTYTCILESFAEKIPKIEHTQLEVLLANSFVNILSQSEKFASAENGKKILAILHENPLKLYDYRSRPAQWKAIGQHILRWWEENYNAAGYSASILKGILKFCSYIDPNFKSIVRRWLAGIEISEEDAKKVDLENWEEGNSHEEFALQAIAMFGKLSTLDEPLIIVFDQLEGLSDKLPLLTNFGNAIKEILTVVPNSLVILNLFPDRWQQFQSFFDGAVIDRFPDQVELPRPNKNILREILKAKLQGTSLDLEQIFYADDLEDMLSQKSIRAVLNRAAAYYRHKVDDIPLPIAIPATSTASPVLNLNNADDFRLQRMEQQIVQLQEEIAQINQKLSSNSSILPLASHPEASTLKPQLKIEFTTQPVVELPQPTQKSKRSPKPATSEHNSIVEYIQQKQSQLDRDYERPHIITESGDWGILSEILGSFQILQRFDIGQMRLGKKVLPDHFQFKIKEQEYVIGFLHTNGAGFTNRIKNFNELVNGYPHIQFHLLRDGRESNITGKVGKEEIDKLCYAKNGDFKIIDRGDRINFELIYNLIVDIKNKDLDADMATGLRVISTEKKDYWLIKIITN